MKKVFMFVRVRPGVLGIAALALLLLIAGWSTPRETTAAVSPRCEGVTMPANYDCQFEYNTRGLVEATNIYLRSGNQITLASDDQKGSRTWVSLPTIFNHGSGTTPKADLPLPNGTFKVTMKVRLAGNKTGFVWLSKRNVVKLEVHEDSVGGTIVGSASIDKSVGGPSDYTLSTDVYSPNQQVDTFKTYYIMIYFDKYDGNGSNDGHCGMEIRVHSI